MGAVDFDLCSAEYVWMVGMGNFLCSFLGLTLEDSVWLLFWHKKRWHNRMTYREIRGMCLRRYSRHTVRGALRFLHFMQLCPSILCHGAMKRAMLAFFVSNICCFVTRRREFIWCIAQSAKEGARGAVPLIMYRGIWADAWSKRNEGGNAGIFCEQHLLLRYTSPWIHAVHCSDRTTNCKRCGSTDYVLWHKRRCLAIWSGILVSYGAFLSLHAVYADGEEEWSGKRSSVKRALSTVKY